MAELNNHSERIRNDILEHLTIAQFCELVARCFSIDPTLGRGQAIEMHWDANGRFRGAISRVGKLDTEALRRMGGFTT